MTDNTIHCFMTGKPCNKIENQHKLCRAFILMPFRQPFFDYYKFAIKEYFLSEDWECIHGGESVFKDGEYIICKICEEIHNAELVIADISSKNLNVCYEFGIAHGLGKKSVAFFNENINGDRSGNVSSIFNGRCDVVTYHDIRSLSNKLKLSKKAKRFPLPAHVTNDKSENYSLICLIPDGNEINYNEVYEFGIKNAIKGLDFFGIDLSGLKKDNVINIIHEASGKYTEDDFKKLIKYIADARYCIVDVTDSNHQEVFYWLGFIHGLRVNKMIKLREDLTCLYITRGKAEELPFDIRAARIIHYSDIEDLNFKVKKEIEHLEVSRIKEKNEEKEKFWKNFNIKNTQFIVGAADSYPPGEKEPRSRISIQDFKSYNRITYQLLFFGAIKSFQYSLKVIGNNDRFYKNYKDSLSEIYKKTTSTTEELYDKDMVRFKTDLKSEYFKNILSMQENNEIKNIIIIGSSCVNPAAEKLMITLYQGADNENAFIFKTFHPYKARSLFWKLIERKGENEINLTEKSGIFKKKKEGGEDRIGKRTRKFDENDKKVYVQKDTALLIVCSGECYSRLSEDKGLQGDIVLISGFGKHGTYSLSRMISRVNKKNEDQKEKCKSEKGYVEIKNIFKAINDFKRENKSCYIEIVFDFEYTLKGASGDTEHEKQYEPYISYFKGFVVNKIGKIEKVKNIYELLPISGDDKRVILNEPTS